ncbi:hypothetical protein ACQ4PT_032687 [Festuca glaucescens]
MGSSLPPKEANLFKVIVKSYETKQYKKGLKAADSILKKFPDHGGLLYRSDREYREAIKCYRNALRIDPDNIEILRDLSLLQAQMRDLSGFVETRQQLLTLKPNHRMNWIGFAVAHHLSSNSSKAIEVLEAYEGTLEDDYPPENERYEHGEMLLYKISLLEECGMLDRALEEMHKMESKISADGTPVHTHVDSVAGFPAAALANEARSMDLADRYLNSECVMQMLQADQIRFFHKINSLPAPGTDSEKLIWNVLEAERPDLRQLHGKSLVEVNSNFLEKHNASLTHRAAAAEMMYLLEPDKKLQAIKLIEDSTNNTASGINLTISAGWKVRCAEYFPCSTYFEGARSAMPYIADSSFESSTENGNVLNPEAKIKEGDADTLNGTVHIVDDLSNLSMR